MGWLADLLKDIPVSAVARERVALAEEKYQKVVDENLELKNQLEVVRSENGNLRKQLASLASPESLDAVEVSILKLLGTGDGLILQARNIAGRLDVPLPKAEFFLRRLSESRHLYHPVIVGEEPEYSLGQLGKKY